MRCGWGESNLVAMGETTSSETETTRSETTREMTREELRLALKRDIDRLIDVYNATFAVDPLKRQIKVETRTFMDPRSKQIVTHTTETDDLGHRRSTVSAKKRKR